MTNLKYSNKLYNRPYLINITYMSKSFEGSQSEAFVAAPRVVKPKRKYKQPEEQEDEQLRVAYNNMMWEKRVVRGNTYAAMVTSKNVELPQKNTFKAKPQRQDDSALEALSHLGRRVNIEIFTDEFVERLTDKPPCYQVHTQTDFNITKPIVRLYMKQKTGTDQETQIQDNDLFDFDYQVQPLLQILCGKTLETSRMEVLQEQQLKVIKDRQKFYISQNEKEAKKIQGMENNEKNLKQQNDRKIALLKQRKQTQRECHKKLLSRAVGKRLLRDIKTNTVQILSHQGFFRNPLEDKLAEQLLPNFYSSASSQLARQTELSAQFEDLLKQIYHDAIHQHKLSLETERTRRALIVANREQKAREKEEKRRMRKEELYMIKFIEDEKAWLQKMENEAQQEEHQAKEEPNVEEKGKQEEVV